MAAIAEEGGMEDLCEQCQGEASVSVWSDHQMKGLEAAVGEEVASKVAKGCRVYFALSVK